MGGRFKIPGTVLFGIASAFGVSSTIQAYWISRLMGQHWTGSDTASLLALNLIYWYVPALVAPVVLALATRYRVGRASWGLLALVHVPGAVAYVVVHESAMVLTQAVLFPNGAVRNGRWTSVLSTSVQQLDWLLMTYLFFVGLAHALAYRGESEAQTLNRAQLETRLVEAQLQSLQRQLRPHFLFNTLHTISGLMRSNLDAADRMMDRLGDLLRMTLDTSGSEEVPLREEIEALSKYLEIEHTRFGDRLSTAIEVAPEALDAFVPYLLLQPLAENAIRYGIAPHARQGRLAILASRADGRLDIQVRDSGNGPPPDRLLELNHGVGLSNTRARLQHLYRTDFEFAFSKTDEGFCVLVNVPFRLHPTVEPFEQGAA
jgi:two-component sensor histidine kinase